MTDVEALTLGLAAYAGVILIIALIAHSRRCPLCPEGVCRPCRPCARANGAARRTYTRTASRAALWRLHRMLLRSKADPGGSPAPHESTRHEWGKPQLSSLLNSAHRPAKAGLLFFFERPPGKHLIFPGGPLRVSISYCHVSGTERLLAAFHSNRSACEKYRSQ